MPPNKKNLICIICLKRFSPLNENNNSNGNISILEKPSSLNPESLECENLDTSNETTHQNVVKDDFDDPYTRFILFVKRYFKLTTFADRLLTCAKEAKNENGEPAKLQTFCGSCGLLVKEICTLYNELQTTQLFLIWKLSLVGELMKTSSGHATDDKTYKSWGARSSMAKQMNVIAVKPVDMFRKALQLKCTNAARKGKTKPVVAIYKGLSPDQWKFTYSAVKEILTRLIIVFTLASTELSEPKPKIEGPTVTEEVVKVKNSGKRRRRGRSKKKINPSQKPKNNLNSIAVKIETENVKMDTSMNEIIGLVGGNDDDEPPSPLENLGNDSDWSRGAPSPMSVCSNISDGGNHADIQPTTEAPQKIEINTRKRRKIVVQVEEEDDYNVATVHLKTEKLVNDIQMEKELPKKFKHQTGATLKCPHCPGVFMKPRGLGHHLRLYHKKNLNYSCKNCGARFKNHREFMRHHRKMHPKIPAELSNSIPGGISTPRRRRRRNGVTTYNDGPYVPRDINPGACTQCSKVFSTRNEMLRHRSRAHVLKWNKIEVYWRVLEMDKRLDPLSPPPQPEEQEEHDNIFVKGKSGRPKRKYLTQKELKLSEKYRKLDCEVESCGKTFETAYLLRKHLEDVHEGEELDKKVHCCYCDRKFIHKQSYEMHVRTLHRTKIFGTFVCDFDNCERSLKVPFLSVDELNEHLISHLNKQKCEFEEISFCEKCNWGFLRPEVRDLHQLVHIPLEKDGRIPCSKCGERCLDMHTLQDHFIDKHDLKNVRAHQCDECEKRYFTKNTFTRHKIWHKRKRDFGPSNGFTCVVCGIKYKDKRSLDIHLREHDPGYFVICKEPGCGKKFGNSRKLNIHITNTHRVREWVCELCGEKYPKRAILMGHLNTHEEAKWPCDECGMKFKRKDKVKAHKLSVHNPDRVHAYVCAECGKGYHNPYGLRYHIDSTHKPESEWELKCPRCPRRFYRKLFLDLHLKKCEGDGGDNDKEDKSTTDHDEIDEKPETSGNGQNEELLRTSFQQSSELPLLQQYQHSSGNLHLYQQFIPFQEQQ